MVGNYAVAQDTSQQEGKDQEVEIPLGDIKNYML